MHRKLQQRFDNALDNLSVDALHTGMNSSRSSSTELGPALEDSRAFVIKRPENSPEIPETPVIVLERMRGEEDDHSDGNEPSHAWSTATDRT